MFNDYTMAEKNSNTSDVTMLTLAKMLNQLQFQNSESCIDTPSLRDKRAHSLASQQLAAGRFTRRVPPTTLPVSRQPSSPEYDAPSPGLVSPTTPQVIEETSKGEHRNRSQSCSTPVGVHQQIPADEIAYSMMQNAFKNRENPESSEKADTVAKELTKWADQFDDTHMHMHMQTVERCFRLTDPEVVHNFRMVIQRVRNELSWRMVAKLLHLGVRLLKNITPESNSVHGQQWNLLTAFLEFLREELSSWVDQQGGWDAFLHELTEGEPLHSTSLPNLHAYQPQPLNPCKLATLESRDESELLDLPELPAAEEDDQLTDSGIVSSDNHEAPAPSCPSPLPVSLPRPIPCPTPRPSTLELRCPNSYPTQRRATHRSNDTSTTSSSAALVSFGLGAIFGYALYSFISGK